VSEPLPIVTEYSEQAVAYVRRALGIGLEYDSDTLPLLDHYLRGVPTTASAALDLVIATAGAYFGEVIRRRLGGRWELGDEGPAKWRLVLTTGLTFSPPGLVASAISQSDLEDLDSEFDAPQRMRPYIEQALARMSDVSVDEYYSLCGRLDTLEHVHEVLVAVAAKLLGEQTDEADSVDSVDDEDATAAAAVDDEVAAVASVDQPAVAGPPGENLN
jgi:hypothetical protein